jgi:aminoglycoside phosphotransferase (APT) family kinase protein
MTSTTPVPPRGTRIGVADPEDVARRASIAAGRPLSDLQPLLGGMASLTYAARTAGGARVVVKVAPPGLAPVRNRDVLRQARVLDALASVPGVAVPAVLGTEAGTPPEVPPLFVMTFMDGESYEPRFTADEPRPPVDEVLARAAAAARMLAALHATSPAALGVDEPVLALADEVERWRAAFATCSLDEAVSLAESECHRRLLAGLPAPLPPAVLHGDWRLGNMQCVGAEIRAVIDWEIWSIGDPRLDLAWMRLMSDPAHPTAAAPDAPTLEPDGLLAAYQDTAGAAVPDLDWFDALVRYKQAAASALLVKNADRRGDASPQIERMRTGIDLLLQAASARLPR